MKIGIVSDSHGKTKRLKAALALLGRRDVEMIVHCGDVGSEACIEELGGAAAPAYAVAGNMDRHAERLAARAQQRGVHFAWEVIEVPIGRGQHLVATHGSDESVLTELIAGGQFRYVCHGHSHRTRDERVGGVRVINPGALYNNRRPHHPTVAVLDTEADSLEYIPVRK
jgi:hypothetical protein